MSNDTIYLSPSQIRYCQSDIDPKFTEGERVKDVLEKLKKDADYLNWIKENKITCVKKDKKWYVVKGNRRLCIIKVITVLAA